MVGGPPGGTLPGAELVASSRSWISRATLVVAWGPCYHAILIQSYRDQGTADVFHGRSTRQAQRACPSHLWRIAGRKLDQLDSAVRLGDLAAPPGNRLEALRGSRDGQFSIRINEQYRICFTWTTDGPTDVEIVDDHR